MVQLKVLAPTPSPVTVEVGEVGVVIVPEPDTKVHKPVPIAGTFPARVAVEVIQTDCARPAFAAVGTAKRVIITVSILGGQLPLLIVHFNTFAPTPKAVNPEVGDAGVVIVAAPETSAHVPAPIAGVLPASVAVTAHTD